MKIYSTYSVKIKNNEYKHVFKDTTRIYRNAVDFFINVILKEQTLLSGIGGSHERLRIVEYLTISTDSHPNPKYDFCSTFYKFPSYYRRAAISEAIGKVDSYLSNLKNWDEKQEGKRPGHPKAGYTYPSLYRDNTYVRDDTYIASVKVWIRNTWDWITIQLNKGDADYILHNCMNRKECVPTLQKRGKEWFLDFSFVETVSLTNTSLKGRIIVSVDLGILSACTCTVMKYDGTVLGRRFLKLPREEDCLAHSINRIKKAQQNGARKTPRLWAKANGYNDRISVLTAEFIMKTAIMYGASVIVFEHLDTNGKIHGSKKQRLALWKKQYVQAMVTDKAHRCGMRISRVNAWNTSKLAYDGSGNVLRGEDADLNCYSLCKFPSGKIYNCDLNASYNIGSRYFIREILESLPVTVRLGIEAKLPQCTKRSTCTLSTLISLNAVLADLSVASC